LLNQDLVAAIQAAANNMKHGGGECFFNDNNKVVDSGILARCRETETCVKDSTSSLGGFCVDVDEAYADILVERQLSTACTFSNGTPGTKCVGSNACGGIPNIANIGCGSCIGNYSCFRMSFTSTVGERSCIGQTACAYGKSDDRAHNVCIQMIMTSTHIYLIKVEKMSGTIPAVEIILVLGILVSRVKLYNVYCVQNFGSLIICKIMLLFYE
jgi:hypothetical protein